MEENMDNKEAYGDESKASNRADVYNDGLAKQFDTVIIGTGIVESILACAIQLLPGKKVLHLDSLDFYGREMSSMNLLQMIDLCNDGGVYLNSSASTAEGEISQITNIGLCDFLNSLPGASILPTTIAFEDTLARLDVMTTQVTILDISGSSKGMQLDSPSSVLSPNKFNHPSCMGYSMQRDKNNMDAVYTHPCFFGYVLHSNITPQRAMHLSRKFSIDLTPKIMFGGGSMVESLIHSDVGRYLEFKSIENVYMIKPDSVWDVPCSKGDVFNSKLLSVIEKRLLMKFLQFASDWGQISAGEEVLTLNERELLKGASLSRPQNKRFNYSEFDVEGFENASFQEFMTSCKLHRNLQEIIMYALCLGTKPLASVEQMKTTDALQALCLHLSSLGKYGSTAFLYPVYGVAEIAQAFCRMCAVWGGIYILRRSVSSFVIDKNVNKVCAIIDDTGRVFACQNVVCSSSDWIHDVSSDNAVCTRISICVGECAVFSSSRGLGIIPPMAPGLDNPNAVHILQLNSSANVCPDGYCLLYITTTAHVSNNIEHLMSSIVHYLQKIEKFNEIFFFLSKRKLVDSSKLSREKMPINFVLCGEEKEAVHFQECVDKAKILFKQLYPGEEFLPPAKAMKHENEEMDEDEMLKAALDTLEKATES